MTIQKYDDGIAFLKDGAEIAFYSYIVNRITFYPQSNEEWVTADAVLWESKT